MKFMSLILLLVVIIVPNVTSGKARLSAKKRLKNCKDDIKYYEEVCLTEGCVLAAARLRGAMDPSINPCDDFYNFACGTWIKQNVIPEDKGSFGTFHKLNDEVSVILKAILEAKTEHSDPEALRKANNFYNVCMNDTQIEQLGLAGIHDYITRLMGWPVMGSNPGGHWDANKDLEDLMILVRKETNSLPVIDIGVTRDDKNPDSHILAVG